MSMRWQLLTTDECNKQDFGNFTKEYDASANCWSSDDEDVGDNDDVYDFWDLLLFIDILLSRS